MLSEHPLIGFIPTADADRARSFYVDTLKLTFESDDQFAVVVRSGSQMIRITRVGEFKPMPFTICGWEVQDVSLMVAELSADGVIFKRFSFLQHDEMGVWTAPNGNKVAWFHDPDGNMLSISQH